MQRKKRGPKPKAETDKRLKPVGFKLSEQEYEIAARNAKACGLRIGVWFREVALGRPVKIVPEINREAWADLGRMGSNLNQAMREHFRGKFSEITKELLIEILDEVKLLRKELRGTE